MLYPKLKLLILGEKGQSLVETAFVMPFLLLLLLGMVDVGLGFRTFMVLNNGARETVRWVSVNPADRAGAEARGALEASRIGLVRGVLGGATIDFQWSDPDNGSHYVAGERVTATIEHDYEMMFGLFTQLPTMNIRAQATMVVLYDQ